MLMLSGPVEFLFLLFLIAAWTFSVVMFICVEAITNFMSLERRASLLDRSRPNDTGMFSIHPGV